MKLIKLLLWAHYISPAYPGDIESNDYTFKLIVNYNEDYLNIVSADFTKV